MRLKGNNLKEPRTVVEVFENTANDNSNANSCDRLWEDLQSFNPIISVEHEGAQESHAQKENEAHLHFFFFLVNLLNVMDVLTIMFRIQLLILAKAFACPMDSIITDSLSSANTHVCWISLTGQAFLSVEANSALSASRTRKVLLTDTNVLGNILMLFLGTSTIHQVHQSSLTIPVQVTAVVTEFLVNTHAVVEYRSGVHLLHDLRFQLSFLVVMSRGHNRRYLL